MRSPSFDFGIVGADDTPATIRRFCLPALETVDIQTSLILGEDQSTG